MDVMHVQTRNVGASPAKKQRHMGRSYAAVVRSSFKGSSVNSSSVLSPTPAEAVELCSNASKPRSQTLESKRTIIVVKDESLGTNKKKQRISSSNNASNSETSSNNTSCNDVHPFLRQLDQALELEIKYRGAVQPSSTNAAAAGTGNLNGTANAIHGSTGATITSGMRDGSSHVLRCLKVWYDLPSDVFFGAVSSIDRFLAKMKAQPKHLSCIAVSGFHLACRQYRQLQQEQQNQSISGSGDETTLIAIPDPADIVGISQSRCSPSDLLRMQNILQAKLELNPGAGPEPPITSLSFLRIMFSVSRAAALRLGLDDLLPCTDCGNPFPDHLLHQLEILACDSLSLAYRPCETALALLTTYFQQRVAEEPSHSSALMGFVSELQKYCNISNDTFVNCLGVVMSILEKYNSESTVAHRQRLVWKLSNRTLRHLRPTDKLRATLPTINETGNNIMQNRSSSESSAESYDSLSLSSEENYEDESEISMEQPQETDRRNNETDIDVSYEVTPDKVVETDSVNIINGVDTAEVENGVDMDIEY
jgi:cyclin G2